MSVANDRGPRTKTVAEAGERRAPTFKAPHFEEEPVLTARAALPFQ